MGEVSGDSSSPLLQIPSPISQAQREEGCTTKLPLCCATFLSQTRKHVEACTQNRRFHPYSSRTLLFYLFFWLSSFISAETKTTDCAHVFCRPSSQSQQPTAPNTLALTHTHSGRWTVSLPPLRLPPSTIFHIRECTQRNWTNHLQVCFVFDALQEHANLLLFNNQACFELPFPPRSFGSEMCAPGQEKTAEHLTKHLILLSTFSQSVASESNLIFFFFSNSWFQRDWKHGKKQGNLTTAVRHNKCKMLKEIQRNHGPFSA